MSLIDTISVTRDDVFKGPCYIAYAPVATSFPGALETVINPTSYALDAAWTAICPTTEDGATLRRGVDLSDGIPIDQRKTNLSEGEPDAWTQEVSFTPLDTTAGVLEVIWAAGAAQAVSGSLVEQQRIPLSAPATFTERLLAIIQEDPETGRMRVAVFRKAIPQVDSEMNWQDSEAAGAPATFKCREDTSVGAHHGTFGVILQEDA